MEFHRHVKIEIGAKEYGQRLAKAHSETQAEFFDGLREGFAEFSQGDKDGAQMLHIKDSLPMITIDFIEKLARYICK